MAEKFLTSWIGSGFTGRSLPRVANCYRTNCRMCSSWYVGGYGFAGTKPQAENAKGESLWMHFILKCRGQLTNKEQKRKPRGVLFVHVTCHLPSSGVPVRCITLSYVGMRMLDFSESWENDISVFTLHGIEPRIFDHPSHNLVRVLRWHSFLHISWRKSVCFPQTVQPPLNRFTDTHTDRLSLSMAHVRVAVVWRHPGKFRCFERRSCRILRHIFICTLPLLDYMGCCKEICLCMLENHLPYLA